MNYQELKQHIKAIESHLDVYGGILASYPKNGLGMVAQDKRDDKYCNARIEHRNWFKKLQAANTHKVKFFKNEYKLERKNRA